ncbi:hypothetical protein BDF14DRAFT_35182 [Spinellus fusiger]|nr:hypothetical protein BDF14DRAFT_35182 [Spinellus fusiger]
MASTSHSHLYRKRQEMSLCGPTCGFTCGPNCSPNYGPNCVHSDKKGSLNPPCQ